MSKHTCDVIEENGKFYLPHPHDGRREISAKDARALRDWHAKGSPQDERPKLSVAMWNEADIARYQMEHAALRARRAARNAEARRPQLKVREKILALCAEGLGVADATKCVQAEDPALFARYQRGENV